MCVHDTISSDMLIVQQLSCVQRKFNDIALRNKIIFIAIWVF